MSRHKKRPKKVWDDVPKVDVYKPNLDAFYKFMYERHSIWVRRFVKRQPPPWTSDPILRDYKFTNVHRELDYGTRWYMNRVVPSASSKEDLLWKTIMYRLLNKVETFEKVGLPSYKDWKSSRSGWKKDLERLHKTGPVFTSAHLTLPTHTLGKSKINTYFEALDVLHEMLAKGLWQSVLGTWKLEQLFNLLMRVPYVGAFISYEICCDLMLCKAVPYHENDWVNPGPGCKAGLRLIFPKTQTVEQFQNRIKELQRDQRKHFKRLGLKFPYLYPNEPLTLRSVEHSLCEFSKLRKMQTGIGKQRQYFEPRDWPDSRGQLPLRFAREGE